MEPTKNCKKERGEGLRKSNIDGVNLVKVHYMHVVHITTNPLHTINLF
jgi:hypothetical protein